MKYQGVAVMNYMTAEIRKMLTLFFYIVQCTKGGDDHGIFYSID